MNRLSGKGIAKLLTLGIAGLFLGFATPARADGGPQATRAAMAKARMAAKAKTPSLMASEQDFKLFGTSFCVPSSVPGTGCDVGLPEGALAPLPSRAEHPARANVLGVSFCAAEDQTGKACDVAWMNPQPAQPWRDAPEIRTADVMPVRGETPAFESL